MPLPHGRSLGSGIGSEGSVPHMVALHGEDDQTVREYRDGDDLRRIHWPATARTGELMVRQEDRPAKRRAVVVLDTRAVGPRAARGRSSSLEWCVTTAASVTAHVVDAGYAVHLLTADPALRHRRRTTTSPSTDGLETLARVGARAGGRAAGGAARRERADLAGRPGRLRRRARSATTTPAPCPPCASPARPARRWSSTREAFAGRGRRGGGAAAGDAPRRPLAILQSSGWMTTAVDARTTPALAWAAVVGGQVVGAR